MTKKATPNNKAKRQICCDQLLLYLEIYMGKGGTYGIMMWSLKRGVSVYSSDPGYFNLEPYLNHVASKRGRVENFPKLATLGGGGQISEKMATWFVYDPYP